MDTWDQWVREVVDGDHTRAIGERIGKSHTTAGTWLRKPTPESAIMLAIAYQADPIEALAAAGFLSDGHLVTTEPDAELKDIPSVRLTAELYRRARLADERRREDPFEGLRPTTTDPAARLRRRRMS